MYPDGSLGLTPLFGSSSFCTSMYACVPQALLRLADRSATHFYDYAVRSNGFSLRTCNVGTGGLAQMVESKQKAPARLITTAKQHLVCKMFGGRSIIFFLRSLHSKFSSVCSWAFGLGFIGHHFLFSSSHSKFLLSFTSSVQYSSVQFSSVQFSLFSVVLLRTLAHAFHH